VLPGVMALFYISIPFMLLGVAVAVVPLLWAIRHESNAGEFVPASHVVPPLEVATEERRAS
jgi:hypothetical protein